MAKALLVLLLVAGSFQLGRLTERAQWPCRFHSVAGVLAPLLGQPLPGRALCDWLLRIPSL
ncbi:hypothetical protein NZK32_06360 [Cyanobium sp. FGCU-52]|nr:hypothetical protein [Cyanobium sp. FGCU52]